MRNDYKYFVMRVLLCSSLILFLFFWHVVIGSYAWISLLEFWQALLEGPFGMKSQMGVIFWDIRIPRALGCLLGGGLLGAVGSVFQVLFKNPLADPYILGVSSGSAIGGALSILVGCSAIWYGAGLVFSSVVGGILSLLLVLYIARQHGSLEIPTLIIAGVVMGSFLSSAMSVILLLAGEDISQVYRWLLGSTTPMFWQNIGFMLFAMIIGVSLIWRQTKYLNALAVDEHTAIRLGVDTNTVKIIVLFASTVITSVVVGSMGILGFVGLVAPFLARRYFGVDMRYSLPGSLLIGGILLLFADLIAQRCFSQIELPTGVITALLGAPVILYILRTRSLRV